MTISISFIYFLLLTTTFSTEWISPSDSILPYEDSRICSGYYQDTIILFGGSIHKTQLTEYNITSNTFTNYGEQSSPFGASGSSQYCTQIANTLYIVTGPDSPKVTYLMQFDLVSKQISTVVTVKTYRENRACLASTNDSILVIGGLNYINGTPGLNTMDILYLPTNTWAVGPVMNEGRRSLACIVSPLNNKLYVIGGWVNDLQGVTSTVEYIPTINIVQNVWQYTNNNLSIDLWNIVCAIHGTNIYIPGGNDGNDNAQNIVHIIDTITDYISISTNTMTFGMWYANAIIVHNVLYTFGGVLQWNPDLRTDKWQYYTLETDATTLSINENAKLSSIAPTSKTTSVISIHDSDDTTDGQLLPLEILLFVLLIIVFIFLIIIAGFMYKRNQRKSREKAKTIYIKNPMVIVVGIAIYDDNPIDPDFNGYLQILDGVNIDIDNVVKLFGKRGLKYDVLPHYSTDDMNTYKTTWSEQELIQFLKNQANILETNLNNENNLYDGLIVIISCHGMEGYIISSDYKKISKTAIHRIFSATKPMSRKIPRLFVYDCCSGSGEKLSEYRLRSEKKTQGKEIKTFGKNTEMHHIIHPSSLVWAKNEDNPDYKLVILNAANDGFQSKCRIDTGSYVITQLTQRLDANIVNNNNKKFLHEILDEIQEVLHDKGKQLMVKTFNNKTEYIKFKARKFNGRRSTTVEMHNLNTYVLLSD